MKLSVEMGFLTKVRSPPARGRGLKLDCFSRNIANSGSPPARGRGLKHILSGQCLVSTLVAPRAGAWIETL